MTPMMTLKEFMDEMLTRTEYKGKKIISREIGYGAKPDVYLNVEDETSYRRFYSCFAEYEKYKENYKEFADWLGA